MKKISAFTLMEVMVVMVLLITMVAFAIPNYLNSVNKTRVRGAVSQLSVLNAANAVYNAKNSQYYPGTNLDINAINSGLSINLVANGLTYSYTRDSIGAYTATAVYGSTFTVIVNRSSISSTNPCCFAGNCYSVVPAC